MGFQIGPSNYAFKPIAEQALGSNQTIVPQRLNAALDVFGGLVRYDSPEHHLGPGFPKNLPEEAAATHIGLFLAWVIVNGFEGQDLKEYSSDLLERVRKREMTGRDFFLEVCDMRLWTSDMNDQANQFAEKYYVTGAYFADYERTLAKGLKSIYHVEDTWKNFDLLAPILTDRFQRRGEVPKRPWWKFW